MLEKDEIQRILEAVQPIEVLKIDGKFFNGKEVRELFSNYGYTQSELDLIDQEADNFTESDFEDYINREESLVHIMGYSYEAGTALKAIDENDFDNAYYDYCVDELNKFNFHGTDVFYTDKELKRVTGKFPMSSYSVNRSLDKHIVLPEGSPKLPNQPNELLSQVQHSINGGINENN